MPDINKKILYHEKRINELNWKLKTLKEQQEEIAHKINRVDEYRIYHNAKLKEYKDQL